MAMQTGISWCDSTANFWIGCTKVSAACDHCYAEAEQDHRRHRVQWGPHGDRSFCKQGWSDVRKWQRTAARNGGIDPALGRRRRVFINSLSDFFDNHRSIVWRLDAWRLIRDCPDLIFILVTKRPQLIERMLPPFWNEIAGRVWLLTTAENQEEADRRVPALLWSTAGRASAAIYGVSVEPLLGAVDLTAIRAPIMEGDEDDGLEWRFNALESGDHYWFDGEHGQPGDSGDGPYRDNRISWVIVGGESGQQARPMHPDWVVKIERDCREADEEQPVAFHFKQWGEYQADQIGPEDARSLSVPIGDVQFRRVGKAAAGRKLFGIEHNGFPA